MPENKPRYGTLAHDFLASIVVFLVALPLCMGIAIASGAPPAAGLLTGIVGGIIVGSLAGCQLQVSGPAAGMAVIVYELIQKHGFEKLGLIVMMAGLLQLVAGALRGGQLFRAISPAVVYGMLAGIGVLIFGAQFHVMVDDRPRDNGLLNLITIPQAIWKGIRPDNGSSHHLAALVGLTTIVVLIAWVKWSPTKVRWIPGALVGVLAATALAQIAGMPIRFVDIPNNLLDAVRLPQAGSLAHLADWQLILAAIVVAFVASAETLLSANAVDQMHDGPRTNYDRELRAQGVGNTICGLIGALPMTGVIVRSSTNVLSGAKTRASTIMHGTWLLVLVAAAPEVLRLVPTSSLAAVLVYTGYKLVDPKNMRRLLSYGRVPFMIYLATMAVIVSKDLLTGIVTGLVLSLANVIYALSHMEVQTRRDPQSGRIDLHLKGAATFIRLPKLADTLQRLPMDAEVHVHIKELDYIDHACMEVVAAWERRRNEKGAATVVEWDELMAKYKTRNQLRPGRTEPAAVAAAQ